MNNQDLGRRIREARESKGKTQATFADDIGVSPTHLSRWEKGSISPGWEYLVKISDMSGVSLDWLLTGGGQKYKDGTVETGYKREFDDQCAPFYRTGMGIYSEDEVISHIKGDPPRIRVLSREPAEKPARTPFEDPRTENLAVKLAIILKEADFDTIVKVRGTIEEVFDRILYKKPR